MHQCLHWSIMWYVWLFNLLSWLLYVRSQFRAGNSILYNAYDYLAISKGWYNEYIQTRTSCLSSRNYIVFKKSTLTFSPIISTHEMVANHKLVCIPNLHIWFMILQVNIMPSYYTLLFALFSDNATMWHLYLSMYQQSDNEL